MRVGLYGGSFNPAHEGHAHVAETAKRRLRLDRVIWLVSPQNPLKARHETADLAERMTGARALAKGPGMIVTDVETQLGSAYTIDTVRALKQRFPGVKFVWIMGADSLATFHRWRGWTQIMLAEEPLLARRAAVRPLSAALDRRAQAPRHQAAGLDLPVRPLQFPELHGASRTAEAAAALTAADLGAHPC
jgi:nicotinate-nucleotide adenylyltransferase